jgi:hypothetical protein
MSRNVSNVLWQSLYSLWPRHQAESTAVMPGRVGAALLGTGIFANDVYSGLFKWVTCRDHLKCQKLPHSHCRVTDRWCPATLFLCRSFASQVDLKVVWSRTSDSAHQYATKWVKALTATGNRSRMHV